MDDECSFRPENGYVPREGALTEGDKTVPIIVYAPSEKTLPEAKGEVKRGRTWEPLVPGWRYLTTSYIYQDQAKTKARIYDKPLDFINHIAEGELWESPDTMGPYQFGNNLTLRALRRQQTKTRKLEAAIRLEKSIKLMLGVVVGSTLFLIIIQSG